MTLGWELRAAEWAVSGTEINTMGPTITAFERSPDGGKGLARDTRVRWALEEVGHSRTSGAHLFVVLSVIPPPSQELESPAIPARFTLPSTMRRKSRPIPNGLIFDGSFKSGSGGAVQTREQIETQK